MKIAQVVCTFLPYQSGMTSVAYYLALNLHKRGHDVTVITPDYHNKLGDVPALPFKVKRLKSLFKYGNAAFLPSIIKELKNFDIVHLHYPFFGVAELIWLFRKKISGKVVLHYHNDPVVSGGLLGKFFIWYGRHITPRLVSVCDQVLFLRSDQPAQSVIKNLIADKKISYSILPNGVDLGIFKPQFGSEVAKQYGLPNGARVLLFAAGMSKAYFYKGAEVLLRAWAILKKQPAYNNVFLFMAGDGQLRSGYEKLAQDLDVSDSVKFLGSQSQAEMARLYNLSEALIIPSLSESLPMVMLEASACAKPTIASDLPSLREFFQNISSELLFKPGDSNDLAEKIKKLLDNPDFAKSIGQRSRELALNYSWEKVVDKLERFYIS